MLWGLGASPMPCVVCNLTMRVDDFHTTLCCGHVGHTTCVREGLWRATGSDMVGEEGDIPCHLCQQVSHIVLQSYRVRVTAPNMREGHDSINRNH